LSEPASTERLAPAQPRGDCAGDDIVLSVRDLQTQFATPDGPVKAVRDVSFDLARGRKLAIVGESGSGKSALAMSIMGLIEPPGRMTGGSVHLNGRPVHELNDAQMCRIRGKEIALIFQNPMSVLDPVKSIGRQLVEALRAHEPRLGRAEAKARAIEALEEVEVTDAARRLKDYPHQYSGGMQQRVWIAIALVHRPSVVIADEPTTALDVTTQRTVLAILDKLVTERGCAVMFITHNLGIVASFCDSVNVMYAGRIVEQASTEQLFRRQLHPYAEGLLRCLPRTDRVETGPLPTIAGAPPNLLDEFDGCAFVERCPVGSALERCRHVVPFPAQRIEDQGERSAACHFARERASGPGQDGADA
jgi:oligopeptide/dipeptide ABC transporter ATP-binding protein